MILIAKMQSDKVFEATNRRKLTAQIIQYYGENNRNADYIRAIYYLYKDGRCNELCRNACEAIQDIVDDGVKEWLREAEESLREQRAIEKDYRANLI